MKAALAAVIGGFVGVVVVSMVLGEGAQPTWLLAGAAVGAFTLSFPFRQRP